MSQATPEQPMLISVREVAEVLNRYIDDHARYAACMNEITLAAKASQESATSTPAVQVPAEASEDQLIELTAHLERARARAIANAVAALEIGGASADTPTPFQAGYQSACEEIAHRLQSEAWGMLPGGGWGPTGASNEDDRPSPEFPALLRKALSKTRAPQAEVIGYVLKSEKYPNTWDYAQFVGPSWKNSINRDSYDWRAVCLAAPPIGEARMTAAHSINHESEAMTAGRRMKHEMMVAQRKRRQKQPATLEEQMEEQGVTEHDRIELRRFAAFLADAHVGMPLLEQIEKHGADYLGFTPDEVRTLQAAKDRP